MADIRVTQLAVEVVLAQEPRVTQLVVEVVGNAVPVVTQLPVEVVLEFDPPRVTQLAVEVIYLEPGYWEQNPKALASFWAFYTSGGDYYIRRGNVDGVTGIFNAWETAPIAIPSPGTDLVYVARCHRDDSNFLLWSTGGQGVSSDRKLYRYDGTSVEVIWESSGVITANFGINDIWIESDRANVTFTVGPLGGSPGPVIPGTAPAGIGVYFSSNATAADPLDVVFDRISHDVDPGWSQGADWSFFAGILASAIPPEWADNGGAPGRTSEDRGSHAPGPFQVFVLESDGEAFLTVVVHGFAGHANNDISILNQIPYYQMGSFVTMSIDRGQTWTPCFTPPLISSGGPTVDNTRYQVQALAYPASQRDLPVEQVSLDIGHTFAFSDFLNWVNLQGFTLDVDHYWWYGNFPNFTLPTGGSLGGGWGGTLPSDPDRSVNIKRANTVGNGGQVNSSGGTGADGVPATGAAVRMKQRALDLFPTQGYTIYVDEDETLYTSMDYGATWNTVTDDAGFGLGSTAQGVCWAPSLFLARERAWGYWFP